MSPEGHRGAGAAADPRVGTLPWEQELCRFLQQRTGIVVQDHQVETLREAARSACARFGFEGLPEFVQALRRKPAAAPEFEYLVSRITVGESYFFRDELQFALLRERFFPELIESRRQAGRKVIRVWSAGCSTGQELYSLAFLVDELLPDVGDWGLHLLGTDINVEALGIAVLGRYSAWESRGLSAEMRSRHFEPVGPDIELRLEMRRRVEFSYVNLCEDSYPSMFNGTTGLDLILCRNVFLYLDRPVRESILRKFSECLVPEGGLLLGSCDPRGEAAPFLDVVDSPASLYRTRHARRDRATTSQAIRGRDTRSTGQGPSSPGDRQGSAVGTPALAPAVSGVGGEPGRPQGELAREIDELLRGGLWGEVVNAVDAHVERYGDATELLHSKATALANLGRLEEAAELCDLCIARDPLQTRAYLTHSLVLMELDRLEEAENQLRKVLYLERGLLEAHYQLGVLRLRRGRFRAGLKSLRNALRLAEQGRPDGTLDEMRGMTLGELAHTIRNELEIYEGGGLGPDGLLAGRAAGGEAPWRSR